MQTNESVLVLIHGHGVDASIWDGIYADLVFNGTILKPDFSRSTNHSTIEGYAEKLYAQLQSAQLKNVVLVGHSMGGYIALALADRHPDMVQGLVLYHSTPVADDDAKRETRRQAIEGLKASGSMAFIDKQMPKMVSPNYPAEKTQQLVSRFKSLSADGLIAGMAAMINRPDRTRILRNASFPILLVLGREDQIIPYEKNVQLAELSDQISVVTIEQAGHLSMVEQPQESTKVIQSFIDRL